MIHKQVEMVFFDFLNGLLSMHKAVYIYTKEPLENYYFRKDKK
jgi:hypothetical protein